MIIKHYSYNQAPFHLGHVVEGEVVNVEEQSTNDYDPITSTYRAAALVLGFGDPVQQCSTGSDHPVAALRAGGAS